MRFGVCTSVDRIEKLQQIGFDYLEANISNLMQLNETEFDELAKRINNCGIKAECFNVLFPKTMKLLEPLSKWVSFRDYLHKAFQRVNRLSGKIVVFGSGKSRAIPPEMSFAEGYCMLMEFIKKTGEIALQYGISIAIEPLNKSESNTINSVAEGAMVASEINMNNVGLLADSFHMFMENEPMENIIGTGRLMHVHIAEAVGRKYPVESDELLEAFFDALKAINYKGRISIEGKTENFEKDAEQALRTLRKLSSR